MGQTREAKAAKISARQGKILGMVSQPGGTTANRICRALGIARGMVVKDIAALRRKGHPIQVSSMITEDGMYVAVYELPKYLKRK